MKCEELNYECAKIEFLFLSIMNSMSEGPRSQTPSDYTKHWQKYNLKTNDEFLTLIHDLLIAEFSNHSKIKNGICYLSGPISAGKNGARLTNLFKHMNTLELFASIN